ncbi:PQQ-dependent sugar dehydrogenase [Myceligenerans cantabricum]
MKALTMTAATCLAIVGCGVGVSSSDAPSSVKASGAGESTTSTSAPSSEIGAAVEPVGEPRPVASDLAAPWSVALHGGTALVSGRDSGDVLEVLDDGSTRVVGTIGGVSHGGEGGLLGLAVDDGFLYAYSTAADGNRIQRFELAGEPGSLGLGDAETVLDGIPAAGFHNGGRIAFGPDGMLYATAGDAGTGDAAQDLDSLAGKILRLTPDGAVPDDNPFDGSLVYSYGHRNPQGIDWADDGTMFASEFGQNTWDELNVITPGGNYGWPVVEGIGGDDQYVDPVQQWSTADASPSGIGIAGDTIFVANLRGSVLRAVPVATPAESTEYYAGEYGRLRDVTLSPDGDLWFLTNNTDGRGDPGPDDDRLLAVPLTQDGE